MTEENSQLEEIVYVSWEESERGWGTRPDGCSLHLTEDNFQTFLKEYWNRQPSEVPDEYLRPAGKPVIAYASTSLYKRIQERDNGLRLGSCEETELVGKKDLIYSKERSGWVPIQIE